MGSRTFQSPPGLGHAMRSPAGTATTRPVGRNTSTQGGPDDRDTAD
jgi:hypothetical protein